MKYRNELKTRAAAVEFLQKLAKENLRHANRCPSLFGHDCDCLHGDSEMIRLNWAGAAEKIDMVIKMLRSCK